MADEILGHERDERRRAVRTSPTGLSTATRGAAVTSRPSCAASRLAPTASAAAGEYIPLAVERVRRALLVWANTGEITGVPESLAGDLPATRQKGAVAGLGARVGAEGEGCARGSCARRLASQSPRGRLGRRCRPRRRPKSTSRRQAFGRRREDANGIRLRLRLLSRAHSS